VVNAMLRQRAKVGVGVVATGLALVLALAVIPAVTASASIYTSSICKAAKAEEAKSAKGTASLTKAMESGNWPVIQKKLLSIFNGEAGAEKQLANALSGASAKVKAAAAVSLSLVSKFKTIIQNAKSLTQFETGITAAESSPKIKAAEKVLDNYSTKLCGPGVL
jgi:hypothetical protein